MLRATVRLERRGQDMWGNGAYGAPRDGGRRKHRGVDFLATPGTWIQAPAGGVVTKLGYPYGDDLSFRYVQITDRSGQDHRVFYVEPEVGLGCSLARGENIGTAQDLGKRYPGMPNHVHYEVKKGRIYLNPEEPVQC